MTSERQLRRHRSRAGYRVVPSNGDAKRIDLLRYTAWLVHERHAPPREHADPDYEAHKERTRQRNAAMAASGRDIGELPDVVDLERRARCEASFTEFCQTYFGPAFGLPWSDDHLKVIAKIERAVLEGGLFAHAMPRGSGKTTLTTIACIWAVLIGARPFVCLICSNASRAKSLLGNIQTTFETNQLLLEDFPEVLYPIKALQRITNRQRGQTYRGEPTRIVWTSDKIVLPTIPGSNASGAVLTATGLEGGDIRGQNHQLPDGRIIRPSLVVLDDPQTTESAWSHSQSQRREALLAGDVLGMAGPGQKIAAIMCCTVIRPDDMADRILDRDKHPQWQGERTKMVYSWPTPAAQKLWDEYARIRAEDLRNDGDGSRATEFYCQRREKMDEGTRVAWPQRFNHDELSGFQHAINLRLRDEAAFFAEYQNEPLATDEGNEGDLTADDVAGKFNGMDRGIVPIGCDHLTMFIDVQQKLLYYVVAAWEDDFTGYVLDYGAWPDQKRVYFTLRDARVTLGMKTPNAGLEGSIYAGLDAITQDYLAREWSRDDGAKLRIDRCLIDANWGASTDVVYQFGRQSRHASVLMPSHGRYVGASGIPFSEYKPKRGDRVGLHWRIPNVRGKRAVRHVVIDTNYWKSFVHARLAVPMGDAGCLSLFGKDLPGKRNDLHRLIAEHITAEYRVRTEGRGRTVDEWKLRAGQPDNHWLDCLVGCAVGASMQGATLFGTQPITQTRSKRIRLSDLQKGKR